MRYRISLAPRAVDDLDSILDYIKKRSPQGAQTWFDRWLEVYHTLQSSADRQPLAPENSDHDEDIHHVIFKTRRGNPYRCLFLIRGQVVHVLHICGCGQNLVTPDELHIPNWSTLDTGVAGYHIVRRTFGDLTELRSGSSASCRKSRSAPPPDVGVSRA